MKRTDHFLIVFLLAGIVSFASFESGSQTRSSSVSCPKSFKRNRQPAHSVSTRQPTLFDSFPEESASPLPIDRAQRTSSRSSSGFVSRGSSRRSSEARRRGGRLTKQRKEEITQDFFTAFKNENFVGMRSLVTEFPFLKKVRLKDPAALEGILERHRRWCPRGWSPLGIAAYKKQLDLFNFLLTLDMDVRTIKRQGGGSVESNPLHISLRRGFRAGVVNILAHVGYVRFGTKKNRFIDEKDHQKLTPWALAIEQDSINRRIRYIEIVGEYRPSGYVSSYIFGGPKDGYEIAKSTGSNSVIQRAEMYLVAPEYSKYKEIRRNSPRPDLKRPH